MKIAVCVPPATCDCYGHLTRYAEKIAETGAGRGIPVDILRATDADFLPRLFAHLGDEDSIVHFHCFLYDLRMSAYTGDRTSRHVLDGSRAKTVATISDHPFTSFMREMIEHAQPSTRFIVIDDTFTDEMRYINPALEDARFTHLPFVPPVNFDETRCKPFEARTYDLVVPLLLIDMSRRGLDWLTTGLSDGWLKRTLLATYEIAREDLSSNPFHIFARCMQAEFEGVSMTDLRQSVPEGVPALLGLLSNLDGIIRHERRTKMVTALLRSVGDLKVAVMGQPVASLPVDGKVSFVGRLQFPEAAELMGDARAVLNCNPTYPANIHERVIVGMLYNSCVITDTNPCIDRNLESDQFVAYAPDSAMTIADVFAAHDIEAIATRSGAMARAKADWSWESHFDAVLQAAS